MALSDCDLCWDTPCTCKRGYLGSKIYAYKLLQKDFEQLKAENASLKLQLLDRTEKYTIAMDKGVLELGDKISALKSKLKIAVEALGEIKKTPVTLTSYFQDKAKQALKEIGGEI